MPLERAVWRMAASGPVPVSMGGINLERRIEDAVEADPSIVDPDLLVIGRQVPTPHSGAIDLLGLDATGRVVVVELKRQRTPRDVVAQALDYSSWAAQLGLDDLREIWADYSQGEIALDDAYSDRFRWQLEDPDQRHRILIVASELDSSTERIVTYLTEFWKVEIDVALFGYFEDGGSEYLVRNWLRPPGEDARPQVKRQHREQAPWDGKTWVVNFGNNESSRSWEDGRRYGFVSAGGGDWYVRTLRNLKAGDVVACTIPGTGYVGIGSVVGPIRRIDEAEVLVEGVPTRLLDLPLTAPEPHQWLDNPDPEMAEHVVLVEWADTRSVDEAVWEKAMYANQNTATKLRHPKTIEVLHREFDWPQE